MWKVVILAALFLGAFAYSVHDFLRIQALERVSDPINFGTGRHALIDRIFYDLGGKWGVAGSNILVGVVFAAWAIRIARRR